MGADQDTRAGMFLHRIDQHFAEPVRVRPAGTDRGIVAGLVHHQNIARFGRVQRRIKGGVFAQMARPHPRDPVARAVKQRGIVQRMRCKQRLKVRGRAPVEMHAAQVDVEANRCLARAARMQGPQKTVLHPQKPRAEFLRHVATAKGGRAVAPDRHEIARPGQARADRIPGKLQYPAHPPLREEPAVIRKNAPGQIGPGAVRLKAVHHVIRRAS